MEHNKVQKLLNDFMLGQQAAMAAYTVALARAIDRNRFAEELRLQKLSFTATSRSDSDRWRDELLDAAWQAIRHPVPPDQ